MRFPSILVWSDPWFPQIAWSFSYTIYALHRVHCSEEDRLSSSLQAFSSWNQSISFYGIQFIRFPDVADVLFECFRSRYIFFFDELQR